jgi:hypothetical protein
MYRNNQSIAIVNGFAISIIVATTISIGLNQSQERLKYLMLLMFFLYGGIISLSVHLAKKNGEVKWQKIFEAGYRTVLVALLGLFLFIFIGNKIVPSYKENQLAEMNKNLIAEKWTQEKIDAQIKAYSKNFIAIKTGQMFMLLLPTGLIFAGLGAFAASRSRLKT